MHTLPSAPLTDAAIASYVTFSKLVPNETDRPFMSRFIADLCGDPAPRAVFKAAIFACKDRLEAGETVKAIAAELGCSRRTVYHWISAFGIDIPTSTRRRLPGIAELIAALRTGSTSHEIAAAAGTTVPSIYCVLRYHGFRLSAGEVVVDMSRSRRPVHMRADHVASIEAQVATIMARAA